MSMTVVSGKNFVTFRSCHASRRPDALDNSAAFVLTAYGMRLSGNLSGRETQGFGAPMPVTSKRRIPSYTRNDTEEGDRKMHARRDRKEILT